MTRATLFASLLFAGVFAGACASNGAVQAPVDVAVAPLASVNGGAIAVGPDGPSATCTLRLVAGKIQKSSPGCYLDEMISKGPGTLTYPCSGTGSAEARFGDQLYQGKIEGGHLALELVTELDWDDGCRWGTRAELRGLVGRNGPGKLAWIYADHVIRGQECSGLCRAETTIAMTSSNEPAPPPEPEDEADYE